jgi:hypothetical protein
MAFNHLSLSLSCMSQPPKHCSCLAHHNHPHLDNQSLR